MTNLNPNRILHPIRHKAIQTGFMAVTHVAITCLALSFLPSEAEARKVRPSVGAEALGQCLLHSDSEERSSQNYGGCCSKDMGICVVCNNSVPATECYIVSYKKGSLPKIGSGGTRNESSTGGTVPRGNGQAGSASNNGNSNSATVGGAGHAIGGGGCPGGVC